MVLHEDKIGQEFLIPKRLTDVIPSDHICFYVKKLVDCYDFSEIHGKFVGKPGSKAYSRKMLLRLVILAIIEGYKSSRDIEKQVRMNIPYMWICGFDTPTYRTIINFKNEYKELLENITAIVLQAAKEEGLLNLGAIGLDGTYIKANAANRNTVSEEILELAKNLINESLIEDKQENEKYGEYEVGDEVSPKLTLKKKIIKLVKASQKKSEEEKKKIEEIDVNTLDLGFKFTKNEIKRIDTSHSEIDVVKKQRERSDDPKLKDKPIFISLTDPYSRFMKNKKGKTELSYNIQNIVDCESGIIIQSSLTQDPTDHYQLKPQIGKLIENTDLNFENSKFLADTAYNTQEGIKYLYENGIDAYIPNKKQTSENKNKKFKKYAKAHFTYDHEKNQYICPEGHILPYKNSYTKNNKTKKVYYNDKCKNCPMKSECSPKTNRRVITHYSTKYQDLMAQKMEKEDSKEIYKKRANSERPFAFMKCDIEWNTMLSENIEQNQRDLDLITIGHNIKLIHNQNIKQIKQKTKKNTDKIKTENHLETQISKNYTKKLACA